MSVRDLILFVHIVAACIWIGGQITLAALVPLLRADRALTHAVARRFQTIAWTAYAVLLLSGVGNALELNLSFGTLRSTSAGRLLLDKMGFVILSGLAAGVHALIQGPRKRDEPAQSRPVVSAVLGAVSLLAALAAALYGVVIGHG